MGLNRIKVFIRGLAYAGLSDNADIEVLRKVFIINLFSTIGMAFMIGFGMNAIFNRRAILAMVLLSLAAITLSNYVLMLRLGNHERGAHMISLIMCVLFFYLLCSGGVDMTGPLWCYAAAPLILFIYGARWGAYSVTFLFVGALALLYIPNPLLVADYTETFKSRFLASFLAVIIMSYLYEYARYRSYTAFQALRHRVEQEARTDELTGLYNRRHLYEYMQQSLQRTRRLHMPMSLLLIDIDNFKSLNDDYGHQFGDEVLVLTAQTLRESLRSHDTIARWGGEEFLVLLTETNNSAARIVAEKLRATIQSLPIRRDGREIPMTISVGMHTANQTESLDAMLKQADANLYTAKHNGRNQVVDSRLSLKA